MPRVITYKFNPISVQKFMRAFRSIKEYPESSLIIDRESTKGLFTVDLVVKENEGVFKLPDNSKTYYSNPRYVGGYVFRLGDLFKHAGNKKSGYALVDLGGGFITVKELWKMLYAVMSDKIGYVDIWKLSDGWVYGFGSDYGFIVSTASRRGFSSDCQKVFSLDDLALKLSVKPPDKDLLRNWEREIFGSGGV